MMALTKEMVGIEAGMEIEATGTLLIGASVEWENIDILVDLLNGDNSHSNGLTPVFKPRSEATGELSLRASLGLPVSVGVKLGILFNGKKASSSKADTNKTTATKTKPTATSKTPQSSKTKQTEATVTKKATAIIDKSSAACTQSAIAKTKLPSRTICDRVMTKARAPSNSVIGIMASVKSVGACAQACLKNKQCMSFGYNKNKACQLYGKNFKGLGVTSGKGDATSSFYDRNCYMYSKCSK
ncbi:unnamed protein product [Fusarium equiseti]|uniref:Apple domain-containing protein n=1 Tax=Fusarium equiseti TaxID=61235 RepID=A0A8J2IRE9_FUSEQ|nr:unnamed protein product [Fusarium equiseti]